MRVLCLIALCAGLTARAVEPERELLPAMELPKSRTGIGFMVRGMAAPRWGGGADLYVAFKMTDALFTRLEAGALWTPALIGWGSVSAELHYRHVLAGIGLGGARYVTGSPLDEQWHYGLLRLGVTFPAFARASVLISLEYRLEFHASGPVNEVLLGAGGEWGL